ncbi:MAG: helix-hairpin-helix domain-containing protein [Rhizobiaceae bacterium]
MKNCALKGFSSLAAEHQLNESEHIRSGGKAPHGRIPAINIDVARRLNEFADLLEQQGADGFREQAYHNAASYIAGFERSLDTVLSNEGREGLAALPHIGKSIAGAISEIVLTGRWSQLERLKGDLKPEKLFQTIPGIGPALANRLAEFGGLETLDDLEAEIHFGRRHIPGLGPKRREALSAILSQRLGRPVFSRRGKIEQKPAADLILRVDDMYRKRAASGRLKRIAPKRFNPGGEEWLPIMHARHDEWHFTALFSNTRLAHELGKTRDWVIIYFHISGQPEGQCTVVTETRGPKKGRRAIRGYFDEDHVQGR